MADESNGIIEITAPTQILVEGKDEVNFFEAFNKHVLGKEKSANIQVHSYKGGDNLKNFLPLFTASPGYAKIQSVGIVQDAEKREASALQSIQSALELEDVNWPIPDSVNVCAKGTPSITALILPGGGRPRNLETLLCNTLSKELTACVDEYFVCAKRWVESARLQSKAMRDKGRARVYLAAQERPYLSVGVAAHRMYWNFEHDAFGIVRNFLEIVSGASGFPLARE